MTTRSLLSILVLAALGGVLYVQHHRSKKEPDAVKVAVVDQKAIGVLMQADAACKALRSGSFHAEFRGEGVKAARTPLIRGSVRFDTAKDWLRGAINLTPAGGNELTVEVACDAERVVAVDHTAKSVHAGNYPFARFLMGPVLELAMPKFGNESPFKSEMEKGAKHEGVRDEGGVPCDVISITEGGDATVWYFAQNDHLPRRVESVVNLWVNKDGSDKTVLTLKEIKPETFTQADFQLAAPEGFAENKVAEPEPLLAVGTEAPDWELKTPKGDPVRLSALRGNVVVLDFWATWCGPCKAAMPKIQEIHAEYETQKVKVFGVNCKEDALGNPDAYMRGKNYTYGLLLEGDAVANAYHVSGIPAFYVIDAKGVIVHSDVGSGNEAAIKEAVKKALEAGST